MMNVTEFEQRLTDGKFAFPGGYEKHFVMADSETVCFDCADANRERIAAEMVDQLHGDKDWQAAACSIHWEGAPLQCANCNRDIESCYGEESVT